MDNFTNKFKSFFNNNKNTFLGTFISISIGLLFGIIVMFIAKPSNIMYGIKFLFTGGMGNIGLVLYYATPIIFTGLSVAFAFKTGLFNIGATGQFSLGALTAIYIGLNWTFLPNFLIWILALICATLVGALWGAIPGVLKSYRNVHEVVSTIMLNYIAMYLVSLYVKKSYIKDPNFPKSATLDEGVTNPRGLIGTIFDEGRVDISFLIAVIMAVLFAFILYKTVIGYELRTVGSNKNSAKYAGINDKKAVIISMSIAGAVAGLGGAFLFLSPFKNALSTTSYLLPHGFTGISVALIGSSNPIGVVFSALFIAFLQVGGGKMQLAGYSFEIVDIIVASVIYCIAFSTLITSKIIKKRGGN